MYWYLKVIQNYFVISGRARRKEYWMFVLFNIIIAFLLQLIESQIGLTGVVSGLYSLAVLIPSITVAIRRLHDTNRSGWWLLIGFIPLIGAIALLVFFILEGDSGSNNYGPAPSLKY